MNSPQPPPSEWHIHVHCGKRPPPHCARCLLWWRDQLHFISFSHIGWKTNLGCSVTLEKEGNPFWGRPFLAEQPVKYTSRSKNVKWFQTTIMRMSGIGFPARKPCLKSYPKNMPTFQLPLLPSLHVCLTLMNRRLQKRLANWSPNRVLQSKWQKAPLLWISSIAARSDLSSWHFGQLGRGLKGWNSSEKLSPASTTHFGEGGP